MGSQHHEAHLTATAPDPESVQKLDELMHEINRYDVEIRSLPDSVDPESDIRKLQARRNELQAQYDLGAAELKRTGTIRTSTDFHDREEQLAAQRDQLVLAQNAPFTDSAPEAQGGESAVPEGVNDSLATKSGVPRQNVAGVIHYPTGATTVETVQEK